MKYVELGRTGVRASILGMGGHEYLQNGKSRGFNEDFKRSTTPGEILEGFGQENRLAILKSSYCRLPRYLTNPRQRRSEWDMAGNDGISRVSAVFRGKSLLTNKMRIV